MYFRAVDGGRFPCLVSSRSMGRGFFDVGLRGADANFAQDDKEFIDSEGMQNDDSGGGE